MNADFWNEFAQRAGALESALRNRDAETLAELADELSRCIADIDGRLNINIGGPDPFRLGILPLPGAEAAAEAFVQDHSAPTYWEVFVGLPQWDPLDEVRVEDDGGESLTVSYSDVEAKVLPPQDGSVTIVLSLDDEFDLSGPRGHLYQAAAENIVSTLLGGWPPELRQVVLLPRAKTGRLPALESIRQQWLEAVQ